jgi:hypothetical protein
MGCDSAQIASNCWAYPGRAESFQVQERVLVAVEPVDIWSNEHLVIEAVQGVVERYSVIPRLHATIDEQRLKMLHR